MNDVPITLEDVAELRVRAEAEVVEHRGALRLAQEVLSALEVIERRILADNAPVPSLDLPGFEAPPQPEK